jgi:hypothetical protein
MGDFYMRLGWRSELCPRRVCGYIIKGAEVIPFQRGLGNAGTNGVYGFAPENAAFLGTPRVPALSTVPVANPPSDLCVKCNLTVEEDCVRLGTYQSWHSHCVLCSLCGRDAAPLEPAMRKAGRRRNIKLRMRQGSQPRDGLQLTQICSLTD